MIVLDVALQAFLRQEDVVAELAGMALALLVLVHVALDTVDIFDLLATHGTFQAGGGMDERVIQ